MALKLDVIDRKILRILQSNAKITNAQLSQEIGLSHVYLGYWIMNCDKMSYKTRYRPYELFLRQQWHQVIN